MAAKLRILFVVGLTAAGLLYADSRSGPRYGMAFRTVDWTVGSGGQRFGIAEYSLRGVGYALRGEGKPLVPQINDSMIYLGPAGSFRARRFLIGATAIALCLGILLVRRGQKNSPES